MDIDKIRPYSKNAKKHPDKQLKQIANSLKEFGWQQPIVVDKDGVIIVGHGRYEAYKKYPDGIKEPEIKVADLTEEQAKAYRLADNKLNESEWDIGLAIEELKGLSDDMFDFTGFDKDLLIEPDDKDDVIPENVEPVAKLGDIWQLGRHRVMCGDSTKKEDVEGLMDGKKADMVFTDPPYGMGYDGSLCTDGTKIRKAKLIGDETEEVLELSLEFIRDFNKGCWYICYHRILMWKAFLAILEKKMKVRNVIIWKKDFINLSNSDYKSLYEPIIVGWQDEYDPIFYGWNENHNFYGKRGEKDIWQLEVPSIWEINKSRNNDKHPTMKPVELICRAVMNSSKQNEIVLDLFLGSGSTLIACEKTNRICYGMELDPKYVDVEIKRFEQFTGQKAKKIV